MSVLGSALFHQSMWVVFSGTWNSEYFSKGRKVGKIPTTSWNFCCEHMSCNLSLVSKSDICPTNVFSDKRQKSRGLLLRNWRQMVWNITAWKCKKMQSRAKMHEFDLRAYCLVVTQSLSLSSVISSSLIFLFYSTICVYLGIMWTQCLWGPRHYYDRGYRELPAVSCVLWERNQSS